MPKYHESAELAPRDVVARAIAHELELVRRPDAAVYLDLTHLDAERVRKRFPMIYSTCMQYNIDIAAELVPIRPRALRHGRCAYRSVRADVAPRTLRRRRVACTGVHGANRLASNSLLEGLVYGARAAQNMREQLHSANKHGAVASAAAGNHGQSAETEKFIKKVQSLMWQHVGVVRDGKALQQVVPALRAMQSQAPQAGDRRSHEAVNIVEAGLLIARSALAREESRGAHYAWTTL